MGETARAPGPWTYRRGHQDWIIDGNGIIALGTVIDEDDARLIAAAPDLLEAAKEALEFIQANGDAFGRKLKLAIAKAENREDVPR